MLREITLGQYYPGTSILHRLDPRVKLTGTLVFIVSLFAFSSVSSYLAATAALIVMICDDRDLGGSARIHAARTENDLSAYAHHSTL